MRSGLLRDPALWLPLLLLALLLVVERVALFSPHLLEWGDLATGALQIADAAQGTARLGPYSRFGFHHPGPVLFYWLAWTEPLLAAVPTPLGRHLIAQLILNLACLGLLVRMVENLATRRVAVLSALLVLANIGILAGGSPALLVSVWGPDQVMLPVTLFVVCCAAVGAGRLDAVLPGTVAAVLAVHTHLGTISLVGPLGLLGGGAVVWHARRGTLQECSRARRIELAAAAGFVAVTSAPVLAQQMGNQPGNLSLIVEFLRTTPRGDHGWVDSVRQVLQAGTDWMVVLLPRWNPDPTRAAEQIVVLVAVLAGSVAYGRGAPWSRRIWIGVVWAVLLLSVLAAYLVKGRLEPYLLHFTYGLFGMLFTFAALALWQRLPRRVVAHRQAPVAALGLLAAALIVALISRPLPEAPADDRPARFLAGVHLDRSRPVLLEPAAGEDGQGLWIEGAGLLLQLERAGFQVRASRRWAVLYTSARRERPGEAVQRVLLSRRRPADARTWIDLGEFGAAEF